MLNIEKNLSDEEITEIFEQEQNLDVDIRKAKEYMNSILFFFLEEKYDEILNNDGSEY